MSQSPKEPEEVEPATQTPDDNEPQQQNDQTEGEMSVRPEDVGYDFEVKEQDRWLPIANGECLLLATQAVCSTLRPTTSPVLSLSSRRCALIVFDTCTATNAVTGVASCPHITLQSASGLHARRIRGFFAGQRSAALVSDWTNKPCPPRPRSRRRRHCHSIARRTRIARTSTRTLTFTILHQSRAS